MKITAIGLDLAKYVFQIHGVDERGHAVLTKKLKRAQVAVFFANLPACVVGMEACSSSHYWARKLLALGHTVRLIAPQFVRPYVKANKTDAADAEAICEAIGRPGMRFVPLKSVRSLSSNALSDNRSSAAHASISPTGARSRTITPPSRRSKSTTAADEMFASSDSSNMVTLLSRHGGSRRATRTATVQGSHLTRHSWMHQNLPLQWKRLFAYNNSTTE